MLKLPSVPVAAKNGCGSTAAQACIQPCTLHSNGNTTSGVVNPGRLVVMVVGWLMLNGRFFFPIALMLWRIPSLFLMASPWPTMIPNTLGWYRQPLWSIVTGAVGVGYLASAGSPVFTYTSTSASVPLAFTVTIGSRGGVVYFAAHFASSLMSIAGLAGALPTSFTLPVTVAPPWSARLAAAPARGVLPTAHTRTPAPSAATQPSVRIAPPLKDGAAQRRPDAAPRRWARTTTSMPSPNVIAIAI